MLYQVDVLRRGEGIEDKWETVATTDCPTEARNTAAEIVATEDPPEITIWVVDEQGKTLFRLDTI